MNAQTLSNHDREILRSLATRKAEIAQDPLNVERRRAWYALDAGEGHRPMVLAEVGGVKDQNRPVPDAAIQCADKWSRGLEKALRREIYQFEVLKDDHVVEPFLNLNWHVQIGNYGVEAVVHWGDNAGRLASRRWDPPIADLDRDFGLLHPRTFSVDREATLAERAGVESVLGDILPVRIRGNFYWTMGLTWRAIELIGLESLMLSMYDAPAALHRLMAFLRDDHLALAGWLEREGLYSLNNENDYIGSGSMGYTRHLPHPRAGALAKVRTQDLWVLLESQETVGVGPGQFEEFVFPYQAAVAERFGKVYYGCCEAVDSRWEVLKRMPKLARVSVSPWSNQRLMAEALGRRYVFSRKPNPSLISTSRFDEAAIRADIGETLEVAKGGRIEIIMKDVHTLDEQPHRLPRWVQLAREEIARRC